MSPGAKPAPAVLRAGACVPKATTPPTPSPCQGAWPLLAAASASGPGREWLGPRRPWPPGRAPTPSPKPNPGSSRPRPRTRRRSSSASHRSRGRDRPPPPGTRRHTACRGHGRCRSDAEPAVRALSRRRSTSPPAPGPRRPPARTAWRCAPNRPPAGTRAPTKTPLPSTMRAHHPRRRPTRRAAPSPHPGTTGRSPRRRWPTQPAVRQSDAASPAVSPVSIFTTLVNLEVRYSLLAHSL